VLLCEDLDHEDEWCVACQYELSGAGCRLQVPVAPPKTCPRYKNRFIREMLRQLPELEGREKHCASVYCKQQDQEVPIS